MNRFWSLLRQAIPILVITTMLASVISVVPVMGADSPTHLVFATQPSTSNTAGTAFGTQPVVTVEDAQGNTVTTPGIQITLAITTGTGTSGAALSGGVTLQTSADGEALFSNLNINLAGTDYTLTATSTGLTQAISNTLSVVAGSGSKLVFATQPSTSNTAGTAFGTQPVVTVEDAQGNTVTTPGIQITLAITTGTGTSGAALSGGVTLQTSADGEALFSNLNINLAGTDYTLTATSTGLTQAISNTLSVVAGSGSKLVFATQPSTSNAAGVTFGTPPVVTVEDSLGNPVTTSTASITLSLSGTVPAGAALAGTATVSAVNGVANFNGVSINLAGTGYTLTATSTDLTQAVSNVFVVVGAASQLAFTTQPSANTTAGVTFSQQPVVTVEDSLGSTVTNSTASITLSLSGTVPTGASLAGTVTVNAVMGVAHFTGLSINLAGTAYTLTATSTGLSSATSNSLTVVAGSGNKLAFSTQPSNSNTAGVAFTGQPVVTVEDSLGNPVTTSTASITLSLSGTVPAGAALAGTATVSAVNGVATFRGLSINLAGTAYTLTATGSGLTSAVSNTLTVVATAASKLIFTTQPSANNNAGVVFSGQPVVTVEDAFGNTVTTSSASIALSLSGTVPTGAALGGTATISAVNGVATFTGLSINLAGTGYTLTAASTGLTSAVSSTVVVAGSGAKLVFTTQPVTANTTGLIFSTQPVVTVEDASGSIVTNSTASITLSFSGTVPSGAALSGTVTVSAVNGVATFTGLSINLASTAYTLTAASSGLTSTISNSFAVALNWWNTSYSYRQLVTIKNQTASVLSSYDVEMKVPYTSHMEANFGDIRFVASDNSTALSYWFNDITTTSTTADVWVLIPSIPASGAINIFMYYGDSSASTTSNINATFPLGQTILKIPRQQLLLVHRATSINTFMPMMWVVRRQKVLLLPRQRQIQTIMCSRNRLTILQRLIKMKPSSS